jgi:DNA-binding HxlR family transcriptional regulator
MKRTPYKQMNCSIASALEVVGEPWSLLIVRVAYLQVRRFEEFQRHLNIARNILTARLRKLVEYGVLQRVQYQDRPKRFEYRLTEKGAALFPVIVTLKEWGDKFGEKAAFGPPLQLEDKKTDNLVKPALIDTVTNQPIELEDVRLVAGPGANPRSNDFLSGRSGQRSAEPLTVVSSDGTVPASSARAL